MTKRTGSPKRPACDTGTALSVTTDIDVAGRQTEIDELFRQHRPALERYLSVLLRSMDDAKEVAQEAYLRTLRLGLERTPGHLRWSLFRIARNLAIDHLRRHARRNSLQPELVSEPDPKDNPPETQALAWQELQRLDECVEELPDPCSQALRMFRLENRTQRDIAHQLGVSERMVRRYINYALTYCRLRIDGATADEAKEQTKV